MEFWTVAWLVWFGAFLALEGVALRRDAKGDTLSEKVWAWFAIKGKGPFGQLRRFALLAGVVWLAAHFLTGGRF